MKEKKNIESEVQKTLEVLDQMKRVEGNPYLYTRLKARLESETETSGQRSAGLSWQLTFTLLVLVINGFFLYQQWGHQQSSDTADLSQMLAKEWGLDKNAQTYLLTSN